MTDAKTQGFQYKVMWKWKGPRQTTQRADYMCDGIKRLLSMLERAEGVTTANTAELYVHQINPNGTISEVLAHNEGSGLTVVDFTNSGNGASRTRVVQNNNRPPMAMTNRAERTLEDIERIIRTARGEPPPIHMPANANKREPKPVIKLQNNGDPVMWGGFMYKAYEAKDGWRRKPTSQESKHGVANA